MKNDSDQPRFNSVLQTLTIVGIALIVIPLLVANVFAPLFNISSYGPEFILFTTGASLLVYVGIRHFVRRRR